MYISHMLKDKHLFEVAHIQMVYIQLKMRCFFDQKVLIFFSLTFHENLCYVNTLEGPGEALLIRT